MKKGSLVFVFFLSVLISEGQQLYFQNTYGNATNVEGAVQVLNCFNTDYAVFGNSNSSNVQSFVFSRFDYLGNRLLTQTYNYRSFDQATSFIETPEDSGFIFVGNVPPVNPPSQGSCNDLAFVKIDKWGNLQWKNVMTCYAYVNSYVAKIIRTNNGNYLFVGSTGNTLDYDPFYAVINPGGGVISTWVGNQGQYDGIADVVQSNTSSLYFLGHSLVLNTCNCDSVTILKTSANGTGQWAQYFSYTPSLQPSKIKYFQNNVYFTSSTQRSFTLTKMDTTGNVLFTKEYTSLTDSLFSSDFFISSRGTIYFVGNCSNGNKSFIMETDTMGNLIWAKNYYTGIVPLDAMIKSGSMNQDGSVVVAGSRSNDFFIMQVDSAGASFCFTVNSFTPIAQSISISPGSCSNNVSLTGLSHIGIAFIQSNPAITSSTCFSAGVSEQGGADEEPKVFPNPANEFLNVSFDKTIVDRSILEIFDVTGKKVQSENISGKKNIQLDVSHFSEGMYFYRINDSSKKFIINHTIN